MTRRQRENKTTRTFPPGLCGELSKRQTNAAPAMIHISKTAEHVITDLSRTLPPGDSVSLVQKTVITRLYYFIMINGPSSHSPAASSAERGLGLMKIKWFPSAENPPRLDNRRRSSRLVDVHYGRLEGRGWVLATTLAIMSRNDTARGHKSYHGRTGGVVKKG